MDKMDELMCFISCPHLEQKDITPDIQAPVSVREK